jgi:large subunit ribosomal protein L30
MAKEVLKKIKITQVRSIINHTDKQKRTIEALGLHRIRHTVIQTATPQILGMVNKVKHLVNVEEVE